MECKICNKESNGIRGLSIHLTKIHKFDKKQLNEYYDKYHKTESEGKCYFCNNDTSFQNLSMGYHKICGSKECLGKTRATGTYEFLMYKYNISKEDALIEQEKRASIRGERIKEEFDKLYDNDNDFHKKRSHNTKEFWINKGYNEQEAEEKSKTVMKMIHNKTWTKRRNNPESYDNVNTTQLKYWLDKGYSEEEAEQKRSNRQITFSLKICIDKYGEEKGKEIWLNRQLQWHKNFKKSNFSKISQELFWAVYNRLDNDSKVDVLFATIKDGQKDDSGSNNEERLKLEKVILPDFISLYTKRIIEFNGVYYHRNTPENKKREIKRHEILIKNGYEVLYIDENKYKQNKEKVIQECIEFLTKK
jgi:hypothetical protein